VPDIVLTTLNARYVHASFGLRYLRANLGESRERSIILEFEASQRTTDVLEQILARSPRVVGIGVYIWNAPQSLQLVAELKRVRPDITVVLGGPEVSHETELQEICRIADYVITGEADLAFAELCGQILSNRRPLLRIIKAELPKFEGAGVRGQGSEKTSGNSSLTPIPYPPSAVFLPYDEYTDTDLAQRVIYVEASRGCPFSCEFCLSSLDVPVRNVPLEPFLLEMTKLFDRGCRQFKFVDRTFNLNLNFAKSILQFFLDRYEPGLFVHFEMVPDRLPEGLREIIRKFPTGSLQFEVGIQTFAPIVEKLISRRQDHTRLEDNLRWLRAETGVHVHADLIVGLPGEDVASFGRGFDKLVALGPQEIQVGILKRLRGTPITRHDDEWGMVYSPTPPYEVLQTKLVSFAEMQRMRRFSRYWDLVANSGSFVTALRLLLGDRPFERFMALNDWLFEKSGGRTHAIALHTLAELLFEHLTESRGVDRTVVADAIVADFNRTQRDAPAAILKLATIRPDLRPRRERVSPSRQARHSA
jgi:radical SAM superfamily enzyme YgiQ (UPF0313 family)